MAQEITAGSLRDTLRMIKERARNAKGIRRRELLDEWIRTIHPSKLKTEWEHWMGAFPEWARGIR